MRLNGSVFFLFTAEALQTYIAGQQTYLAALGIDIVSLTRARFIACGNEDAVEPPENFNMKCPECPSEGNKKINKGENETIDYYRAIVSPNKDL